MRQAVAAAAARAAARAERPEVWPEHWHAWCVFLRMAPHWHVLREHDGSLTYLDLRYERMGYALAAERQNPHRQPLPALMDTLQTLELRARDALNKDETP